MRVRILKEITLAKRVLHPGEIIDMPGHLLEKLKGKVQVEGGIETIPAVDLWSWFVMEANRVYNASARTAGSWEKHRLHKQAANEFYKRGNLHAAKAELELALAALSGTITTTQQKLI